MKTSWKRQLLILPLLAALTLAFAPAAGAQEEGGEEGKEEEKKELSAKEKARQERIKKMEERAKEMGMMRVETEMPPPLFVGTPKDIRSANLEKPRQGKRPPLFIPQGSKNLAKGKKVTSSDPAPVIGDLEQITDGDKKGSDGSYVELGPGVQWVQVDLGEKCKVYAIYLWHYHEQARVYHDVVVKTSTDKDFIENVKTVYNNDHDNSAGLGLGRRDKEYIETNEGREIEIRGGVECRYIRVYSSGNTSNDLNHYIEVEAWGMPLEEAKKQEEKMEELRASN